VRVLHLSPTTLTTDERRLILRATLGNVRDPTIISLALGTGLLLAEIFGFDVRGVFAPDGAPREQGRDQVFQPQPTPRGRGVDGDDRRSIHGLTARRE
jgi:hypothetical protein